MCDVFPFFGRRLFSGGRSFRCARRARSCRPHTHATCERRNNTNASSEEALVHVEVDRCIDEDSASNLNYSPSFTEALSIKTEAPSRKYSVLNPQRPSPARTASRTRSREPPEPGDTGALRRDAHDARLEMYIVLACVMAGRNRRSFLNYILEPV